MRLERDKLGRSVSDRAQRCAIDDTPAVEMMAQYRMQRLAIGAERECVTITAGLLDRRLECAQRLVAGGIQILPPPERHCEAVGHRQGLAIATKGRQAAGERSDYRAIGAPADLCLGSAGDWRDCDELAVSAKVQHIVAWEIGKPLAVGAPEPGGRLTLAAGARRILGCDDSAAIGAEDRRSASESDSRRAVGAREHRAAGLITEGCGENLPIVTPCRLVARQRRQHGAVGDLVDGGAVVVSLVTNSDRQLPRVGAPRQLPRAVVDRVEAQVAQRGQLEQRHAGGCRNRQELAARRDRDLT